MTLVAKELTAERLRDLVQDAHLSFLFGAGASAPMFRLLGDIENLLTSLDASGATQDAKAYARASIYSGFFRSVVLKNNDLLDRSGGEALQLLERYEAFLQTINRLLLERRSSLLNKQVNLYTTNVDLATEIAAESLQVHLNDGFAGRLQPRFSTSNFGSVVSRRSLQYDNLSEVPTFNLLKLHGSVGWSAAGEASRPEIGLDTRLRQVAEVAEELDKVDAILAEVGADTTLESLLGSPVPPGAAALLSPFLDAYSQLAIVNPTKAKFQQTVLNQNYYDLLRLFSNELEKENAALFVVGFSCRDEHIRELMVRAARTNPTLQLVIFAYSPHAATEIEHAFDGYPITNSNIWLIAPPADEVDEEPLRYDLPTVTSEFFAKVAPSSSAPKQSVEVKVSVQEPLVDLDD
ncbi:SIR2 family protein [Phycicoccus sp. MAQZ13P-2]|uniref:SIR2 family protein n=1 Tax=Phycicoccus mangrovi TaxID=2840470 RepID=UPI001C002658|nr:SIR2 family protein [Phycicoccus mangrovi]MBT9255220.1 SIR2 family protein [Phycicoccus mangrovi]MBT9274204.1 SIR2 family protein [Phycicoccus mangrovi]